MTPEHEKHLEDEEFVAGCEECYIDMKALNWVKAVRDFGLERANEMYP